jgi:DNA repair protein RadC
VGKVELVAVGEAAVKATTKKETRPQALEASHFKADATQVPSHQPIHTWPPMERPRERLLAHGAAAISDAELLALLLRTGNRGQSAVELARSALVATGGLSKLLHLPAPQLSKLPGWGPARAACVASTVELARRLLANSIGQGKPLDQPALVFDFLRAHIAGELVECFYVLFLDARHALIEARELFRGTLSQTAVYPREVLRSAIALNASAVIVAHNHPSGTAEPSHADHHLTQQLKRALNTCDIQVLDHIVVTQNGCYSFAQAGVL